MKKIKGKLDSQKVLSIVFYSAIYAIGLQLFMQPANLLTTGMAGVGQILSGISGMSYGMIYFILNIPGIFIGFKYIGKKFTLYSMLSIVTVSLITAYVPVVPIVDDIFVESIFGGIIIGFSIGRLLKIGASSGGTDFFAMYLLRYKNVDFQKVNFITNIFIILFGTIYFAWSFGLQQGIELGLYTIISLYIRNSVMDQTFTNANTITLFIVGTNIESVSSYINKTLKRGTTIINEVEGGYTHSKKQMLMATLNQYEYSIFIENVYKINPHIFINIMDTKEVRGNYKRTKQEG